MADDTHPSAAEHRKTRQLIVWIALAAVAAVLFFATVGAMEAARDQREAAREAEMKSYFALEQARQALQRR